ncbi:hypothetical protein GCM10020000_21590 [Streptomyces olivoverticillatus]
MIAGRGAFGGGLAGQPEDFREEVGEGDVIRKSDVDPAVRGDDRHPAITGGSSRTHLMFPPRSLSWPVVARTGRAATLPAANAVSCT